MEHRIGSAVVGSSFLRICERWMGRHLLQTRPLPSNAKKSRKKVQIFWGVFWLAAPVNPKCGYSPVNLQIVAVWACKGKSLKAVELAVYQRGKWRNICSAVSTVLRR